MTNLAPIHQQFIETGQETRLDKLHNKKNSFLRLEQALWHDPHKNCATEILTVRTCLC